MAKNILQDIVPPEKRSIRNIPVPKRSSRTSVKKDPIEEAQEVFSDVKPVKKETVEVPKVYPYNETVAGNKKTTKMIWWGLGVAAALALFAVSAVFSGATVKVSPVQESLTIKDETFKAEKESTAGLPFEVVKLSSEAGKTVAAKGEEKKEIKASGQITIYNDFDKNNQRLIKNTRFETSEGLIYRINESVVVPGQKTEGGKQVPGSVTVTVYADEPGDKYNIGLKDFTIPGFKNDPRFEKIYARSKTNMTGGFIGIVKTVAAEDLKKAQDEIHAALSEDLAKQVGGEVPADAVLYKDASIITFESLPQTEASGDSVKVNERGTISAIVFKKDALTKTIVEKLDPEFAQVGKIEAPDLGNLDLKLVNKASVHPDRDESISFTLNGALTLLVKVDEENLKASLAGQPKTELSNILTQNFSSSIKEAEAVVMPFWKRSFPSDTKDIKIVSLVEN